MKPVNEFLKTGLLLIRFSTFCCAAEIGFSEILHENKSKKTPEKKRKYLGNILITINYTICSEDVQICKFINQNSKIT
jgi:hypothetical protein